MALDPALSDQLSLGAINVYQHGMARLNNLGDSLVQGLGVIQNLVIQENASLADEAAKFGAMRTSIHIPEKSA